jgi:hypothetical protein
LHAVSRGGDRHGPWGSDCMDWHVAIWIGVKK